MTALGTFLVLASAAVAQAGGPAKLMVFRGGSLAITDYPSMARCEEARQRIAALVERMNSDQQPRQLPDGGVITKVPVFIETHCIPG